MMAIMVMLVNFRNVKIIVTSKENVKMEFVIVILGLLE